MQLEIAPQHHLFIIGRSGANIKQIIQHTGATIRFPDPNNSVPQRKGTVFISGAIESVFLARQHLIVSTHDSTVFVRNHGNTLSNHGDNSWVNIIYPPQQYRQADIIISPNELFSYIMVLASPPSPPRLPVDPDDVNTLIRQIFNLSL